MTLRVVQWTTGNVGTKSVHASAVNSELELVGGYAWSPDKVGCDVGELCGIGPLGVEATADYAAPVHEGRNGAGRRIYARPGGALRFEWHGRIIFRQSVRMGSTAPRPFMRNAARRVAASDPRVYDFHPG